MGKKIGKIALNALLYFFLALCVFVVFVTVLSKKDSDGAAEVFGYQMRIVTTNSMEKSEYTDVSSYKIKDIPLRSMVFIKVVPSDPAKANEFYASLKKGDVLTFRYVYTTQVTITHRITEDVVKNENGGYTIVLAGDNKNSKDGQLVQVIDTSVVTSPNYVIGKVTGQARLFGWLISFLMKPVGIVMLIIVPCFFIILFEVFKIFKFFGEERKKQEQEEKQQKEDELELLRRKLAALEMGLATQVAEPAVAGQAEESQPQAAQGETCQAPQTVTQPEPPSANS